MAHLQFVQSGQSWWMGSEEVVMRQLSEGSPPKPFCLWWRWCWRCCFCWPRPPGPNLFYLFYDTDVGQGSQFSCASYANMCGVVVKRVDWEVLEDIWIFDTGGEQAVTKRKPWEILGVKYGFTFLQHLLCGSSVNFGCLHITTWFIPPAPAWNVSTPPFCLLTR